MSGFDLRGYIAEQLEGARKAYLSDLEAMSHEALASSPGGAARTGYDFTYETAVVNERIAARLRGTDPGPYPDEDGWILAPAEFRDKAEAARRLSGSAEAVIAAWNALSDEGLTAKITLPHGESTPLSMASLASVHMRYHDAQLNYIQAIHGDESVHWND